MTRDSNSHVRELFTARIPFELDRFQIESFDAIDRGEHVVVAAPTGSGKTLVAEYGVARALGAGRRAFYTAPIKALSNQKFRDLTSQHGASSVGLLTGDVATNADAPVVVMTTEVLRNMLYAGSRAIDELDVVVLDEVHFLQDAYRGPVWEEVIIHLPARIQLVCLSATVSNADQLAAWMTTVRGRTQVVTETRRPVELENHYLVEDLTNDRLQMMPTLVGGTMNRDALKLDESGAQRRVHGRPGGRSRGVGGSRRLATPRRVDVIDALDERDMLPAIYFIFSRNQCDEAARMCLATRGSVADSERLARIVAISNDRLAELHDDDFDALNGEEFLAQLHAGVASHHAGLLPAFKEVVEQCFAEGLLDVVFATETLAVGINMPARSVVVEKTTKYNGDHHVSLSPGEFTQLTGRAGRRGIDERGHAVVLWSPFVRFPQVAELVGSGTYNLRSVFRPTFNMVANLISQYDRNEARELLTMSFAQFQRDEEVVRLQARAARRRTELNDKRQQAASPFGDIEDYRRSMSQGSSAAGETDHFSSLRPGDVIHGKLGSYRGPLAVVATASRTSGTRLTVVAATGRLGTLTAADLDDEPNVVGRVELPGAYSPHRRDYRSEVARRLKGARLRPAGSRRRAHNEYTRPVVHPVEDDPMLAERLNFAKEADRRAIELDRLERDIDARQGSLARDFDGVTKVMAALNLVDVQRWGLTDDGQLLSHIFHECDLLVTCALRDGLFDELEPPEFAALVSTVVYEYRGPDDPPPPWYPTPRVRERARDLLLLSRSLNVMQRDNGIGEHREPDPGFIAEAHAWCAGAELAELVTSGGLPGGDIIRNLRQVIDLCKQISDHAPLPETRAIATQAVAAMSRGLVVDVSVPANTFGEIG